MVRTPRITNFEIQNANGEDISGGTVAESNSDDLTVVAESNYEVAEDLELTIENANGLNVTDDALTSGSAPAAQPESSTSGASDNSANAAVWDVDLSDLSAGTYTFEVAGVDDLDFGSAVQTTTIEVTGEDRVSLNLRSEEVTQGEDSVYEIRGGLAGDYHLVTIESSDFRDGITADNASRIFRSVGDVVERGVIDGSNTRSAGTYYEPSEVSANIPSASGSDVNYAYAIVQIDDDTGLGVGSIETQYLDTSSITVYSSGPLDTNSQDELLDATGSHRGVDNANTTAVALADSQDSFEEDDTDLTVSEGTVSLESPGNTYTVGSEVEVNGTAPAGMDEVAIYARDEGDFELVTVDGQNTLNVNADGTFSEEDVVLSQRSGGGNAILSLPGSYRIGVIDATDADTDDDGTVDSQLNTSAFNSGTSNQRSIRVIGTSLNAEFPSLIRGQIATNDGDVDVNGSAPGIDQVLFIAVDDRGNVDTETITVESDDTFSEEDIALSGISEGALSLHVYSPGRDGDVGDGDVPDAAGAFSNDLSGFQSYLAGSDNNAGTPQSLEERSLTGDQVRSAILSETTEDTASDDSIVSTNTRLVDAQTSIVSVYQEGNQASGINPVAVGETMVVSGTTNLQPEDNTITVELSNEDTSVGLASTEEWGSNGQWSVTIDTTDASTGTYTVQADDGDNTVTEEVELVESVSTPTPTETTETTTSTPTETATPEPSTPTETVTATPTPTEGGGPGFGAVIAVIALLAAALLAVRREH